MKLLLIFILQIIIYSSVVHSRGVNGGMSCAVCTVVTGIVMQVAEVRKEDFFNATQRLCEYLPNRVQNACFEAVQVIEPYVTNLSEKFTPDLFCLAYGTCELDDKGGLCHLFPLNLSQEFIRTTLDADDTLPKIDFCKLPFIDNICKILNNSYISLTPIEDFDQDGFSALETGRGYDWRGRDCADNNNQTYPGRRPLNSDLFTDSNCNGIWGTVNNSLKSWDQTFCSRSESRGFIYIGDSIGAHFHMPEVWINPLVFSWPGVNGSNAILDEIDWPQFGFATGFKNITDNTLINGLTDSIYLRLRNRNLCNHRDYQNLAQNGASSYEGINHVNAMSRNPLEDNPVLVIYAMQGNDVCNNFNETETHMTPPHVFKRNVMKTLLLLDKRLPSESHVILMGLVEADFIYPAMAQRLHPIGTLHKNVYYKDLYNWFNCLQIGPCTGWLNSNETLRKHTSKKARALSRVLKAITQNEKFEHFDVHYISNPITYLVRQEKINIPDFLEAVDSLHPNQKAQVLLTDVVWNALVKLPPEVIGPINPYNLEIVKIFGDQGGH